MQFWSSLLYLLLAWISFHFVYAVLKRSSFSSRRLPPGPLPLPLVGNLLALGFKPHISLAKIAKVYGPVINLELGVINTVVISSVDMAREVLKKKDASFLYRAHFDGATLFDHMNSSLGLLQPGPKWRAMRRMCTTNIFSSGKLDASHEIRRKKVLELISSVEEGCRAGTPLNIGQAAFNVILNSMSRAFFSKDLSDGKAEGNQEFKELIRGMMELSGEPNLADFFPQFGVLSMMDLQRIKSRSRILTKKMLHVFDSLIEERLKIKKLMGLAEQNDVLDALLEDITEGSEGKVELSDLSHLFLELFLAGTDTTASTTEWTMTELLLEIELVIGKDNPDLEAERGRLPYLQAVKETLRLHPPAPFLVPRAVFEDVKLGIYTVPKDSRVFVNTWAMGRDPSIWERPSSFEPERFLGSWIDFRGQDFELIPFGAGRRMCPGLPLASRIVHLIVGSLIHSFDWKLPGDLTPETMDMEEKFGFTLQRASPLIAIPVCQ
ncbi:Geraniol 8-hydroxylase-like protein [Drosera capensis]